MADAFDTRILRFVSFITPRDSINFFHDGVGAFQRGRIGKLYIDQQVTFVLSRDESGRNMRKAVVGRVEQSAVNTKNNHGQTQKPADGPCIATGSFVKELVEQLEEPAEHTVQKSSQDVFLLGFWTQQQGCQSRTERQRVHG